MAAKDGLARKKETGSERDYTAIAESADFKELLRSKYRFLVPMSIFFMVFYFTLPVLTSYFNVLNKSAIGDISWAWLFAAAQFIMTWTLCIIYSRRAAKFDLLVEKITEEA